MVIAVSSSLSVLRIHRKALRTIPKSSSLLAFLLHFSGVGQAADRLLLKC
jgi:hypothetical protein